MEIEFELNGAKLKCNENGDIWKWTTRQGAMLKIPKWVQLNNKLSINKKTGYKRYIIRINNKDYTASRVLFYAFNLTWNITDISLNNTIDHIDRNSLNNHISNLRIATITEQNINKNCIINQKGYCFRKKRNKYEARIRINGKQISLGYFNTEEEASLAYQNAVIKYRS